MSSRAAVAVLALFLGCADFGRGAPSPDAGAPPRDGGGGGEAPSYEADVHPLLTSGCLSCHRAGGAAGNTDFVLTGQAQDDYLEATSSIDIANPSASRLVRKASGAGHGGGAIYAAGTPEYSTLLAWIAGGAQP